MKTTADHLQDAHDEIKRLESILLEDRANYFRCSVCEKVKDTNERDADLLDRGVQCCEDSKCQSRAWFQVQSEREQADFETYLFNNR